VTLAWVKTPDEPSPLSSNTSRGYGVISALVGDMAKGPVAPGLVTAGTDSRYLAPVADDIYRFQPMRFTLSETAMIHGTNERLTLSNLELAVQFYARLIATAAAN
jgi:carboxypeptidase PM20D1